MNLNSVIIKYHRELNRLRISGKTNPFPITLHSRKGLFFCTSYGWT